MTEEQFENAVKVLTIILNTEYKGLKEQNDVKASRAALRGRGFEYAIRVVFGEKEADRVINEAESRADA